MSLPSLPPSLDQNRALGICENEPIAQYEIGAGKNLVYLILDWSSKKAALVDPQRDLTVPLRDLIKHGFTLEFCLLTHTHHDHIAGVPELHARGIPICVHLEDQHRLPRDVQTSETTQLLRDSETLLLGGLSIRVLYTPGHSAGECCFYFEARGANGLSRPYLLTGDTVFIRDCGRTDFPDGSNEQMFQSLQRIKSLPAETVILPGHHYALETASTLARELLESPPFCCRSTEELAALP